MSQSAASACSSFFSIILNVIGGFLTVWIIAAFWWTRRRFEKRKFKAIFGTRAESFYLCYGNLILHPAIGQWIPLEHQNLRQYPLTKRTSQDLVFSAENTASACEIRAAAYVASALGTDGGISSEFRSDDSLSGKLDADFIAFGSLSNRKTMDVFSNEANDLVHHDPTKQSFVSRKTGAPLCIPSGEFDCGIILKIHPKQFPHRTWIVCAGLGEWGTSGAAYFLGKKWREIEARVKGEGKFLCVLHVKREQDESATLLGVYQSSDSIPLLEST